MIGNVGITLLGMWDGGGVGVSRRIPIIGICLPIQSNPEAQESFLETHPISAELPTACQTGTGAKLFPKKKKKIALKEHLAHSQTWEKKEIGLGIPLWVWEGLDKENGLKVPEEYWAGILCSSAPVAEAPPFPPSPSWELLDGIWSSLR